MGASIYNLRWGPFLWSCLHIYFRRYKFVKSQKKKIFNEMQAIFMITMTNISVSRFTSINFDLQIKKFQWATFIPS